MRSVIFGTGYWLRHLGELQLGHAAEERAEYRQDKNDGPFDTRATGTRVIHHFYSLFFIPPATIK